MTTTNSYRVQSTYTTASLMWLSAMLALPAGAKVVEREAQGAKAAAPVEVFRPVETANSRVDWRSGALPTGYRFGTPFELSHAAITALGAEGCERLGKFEELRANWDGQGAQPINSASLEAFSQFFRDTDLNPPGLAVFMSRDGDIAVNWIGESEALVELEFVSSGVHFFFEATGDEGIESPAKVAARLHNGQAVAA